MRVEESVDKPTPRIDESSQSFNSREILKYILQDENISQEDYFEKIFLLRKYRKEKPIYFDEVDDIVINGVKKSLYQRLAHLESDEEEYVKIKDQTADLQEEPDNSAFIHQIENFMKKQKFLQEKIANAYQPKHEVPDKDIEIELIQQSKKNNSVPEPILLDQMYLNENKLAIINKLVTDGQLRSIALALKYQIGQIHELCFLNNNLSSVEFNNLIKQLS